MGWNGSGGTAAPQKPKATAKKPSPIRGLVAGLVVVGLAVGAYCVFFTNDEIGQSVTENKGRNRIKEVKTDVARKDFVSTEKRSESPEAVETSVPKVVKPGDGYPRTNANGSITKRLKSGETYLVFPHGKDWKKKYPFSNPVETQLSWYAIPGAEVPPMLPVHHTEKDLVDALVNKVVIDEDDDDETVMIKESVQELKDQLRAWIKEGGTVEDYIRQLARRQALEADTVKESRKMVLDAIDAGDVGLAKDLAGKLNEHLKEKGLPSLRLPRKYRELVENYKE